MLLIVIAVIIWLICIVGFASEGYDWGEKIGCGFMAALFGGLIIIVVWALLEIFLGSVLPHTLVYEQKPLEALQDGNQSGGSFFLGIGTLEGKPTYTYYVASNGGYRLQNVGAAKIDVFQDTDKPYLKIATDCKSKWQWLALCNSGSDNTSDDKYDVVEIHVPKATIKQNYVLDAK